MQAGTAYVRRGLWRGNVGYALRMRFSDEAKSVDQVAKEGMRELIDSIRMDPNRLLRTNKEKKVEISQILKAPPRYIPKSLAASSAPGVIRQFYAMPTFFPNRQVRGGAVRCGCRVFLLLSFFFFFPSPAFA